MVSGMHEEMTRISSGFFSVALSSASLSAVSPPNMTSRSVRLDVTNVGIEGMLSFASIAWYMENVWWTHPFGA